MLETAIVVGPPGEEIHTDELGRVKVQFHWDREGKHDEHASCWIRVAQTLAGAGWGTQFIPRVGMEVIVSFLGGDHDCPVVTGCVYNATHPPPFSLPANRTRSGIVTQTSPGGSGHNELSFQDVRGMEQVYLHAQRDLREIVEANHEVDVLGNEAVRVMGSQFATVGEKRGVTVDGDDERVVRGTSMTSIDGNRIDTIKGRLERRVGGELLTEALSERHRVLGRADLEYGDDYTVRTEGCHTTVVGTADRKRSYALHVEGPATVSSSETVEVDGGESILLRCGRSFIKLSPDRIEIVAPAVTTRGEGGGIRIGSDDLRIDAKSTVVRSERSVLIKAQTASLSLKSDVQIDGKMILLNSPDGATDPVKDDAPPRTTIELKDESGKPLGYERFRVTLDDGSEISGILDKEGRCELDLPGPGSITFPDLGTRDGR